MVHHLTCRDLTIKDNTAAETALEKAAAEIEQLKTQVDIRGGGLP